MSCSKCKTFGWHENLPAVYIDDKGEKYCVFHAPQGKKKVSVQKFNKLIFERIDEAKKSNTTCILDGTVFEGDISFRQFDKDNPLPEISFVETIFSEKADFTVVTFTKVADFWRATFSKDADFAVATFSESARFMQATFSKNVDFRETIFSEGAYFWRTTFKEEAYFWGATFKETDFNEAIFNKTATFWKTTFREKATFWKTTFNKIAHFAELAIAEKIRFEGVNLSALSFIDTDLIKIDFINCEWHKYHGRNVLYDEICLFKNKEEKTQKNKKTEGILLRLKKRLKQEWIGFLKDISCDKEQIKKVEILYRQLKGKCKEEHNELDISDWHYGEKEMYRKGNSFRRFFPLSLAHLYWLSSGYGERPRRAGIILLLLILAISVVFGFTGLNPNPEIEVNHINGINDLVKNPLEVIVNTLQYATFEKDTYFMPQNIWGTFLKIFAKLFIPLQAALFAFSVRNRFRR